MARPTVRRIVVVLAVSSCRGEHVPCLGTERPHFLSKRTSPRHRCPRSAFSVDGSERRGADVGRPEKGNANRSYLGFPFCLRRMAPLYTRSPRSHKIFVRRTIVQLQRPSPEPRSTWNRLEPLLPGQFLRHRSILVPFLRRWGFRCTRARVSLPAPAAPRSSAASRRRAADLDDLPPAGASSTWHASPAGLRLSPAAAGDS